MPRDADAIGSYNFPPLRVTFTERFKKPRDVNPGSACIRHRLIHPCQRVKSDSLNAAFPAPPNHFLNRKHDPHHHDLVITHCAHQDVQRERFLRDPVPTSTSALAPSFPKSPGQLETNWDDRAQF